MTLDLEFVRAQFPAFAERSLRGQAFFENAGGSYACAPVIERLMRFYRERKVQPYGAYDASRVAGEEMDSARIRLAAMLGVAPEEVSFGPSTTQNIYVLAQAFREFLSEGDAIIVTNQDHEANSGAWRRLADAGIEVREWQIDPQSGHLDPADLPALIDERARLLVFPHCSNIVAEINDVKAICAVAREAGLFTCVDGVSFAPHGLPDVGALGADIYLFSTYKTYGPHQGIMVIRGELGRALPAQGHWFNADVAYQRFTPAGPDHAQVAACAGLADYMDMLHAHHFEGHAGPLERAGAVHALMREHEIALTEPLLDFLKERPGVRLIGPHEAARRAPTIALELAEPGAKVAAALAPHGIMAGGGDFYGVRPLEALGIDRKKGVLRLSFVHYTSREDIDHLIRALDHLL